MARVLKGRSLNLTHSFLEDETPLTVGPVAVTLSDLDGTTVAGPTAATTNDQQVWTVSFPRQPLGVYTATWDGDSAVDETPIEVVGGFLFSVPDARRSDDYLSDADAFPAAEIAHYREVAEAEFEKITGRSFTTRIKTVTYVADNTPILLDLIPDSQAVESVSVNGEPVEDVSGYRVSRLGKITAPACFRDGDLVTATVRYGFPAPPPDVARVGMVRVRALLAAESSGIPDRATTWQPQEGGTFRLATAGQGKWRTGIPEVDSTLSGYRLDTVLSVYGIV